MKLQDIVALV